MNETITIGEQDYEVLTLDDLRGELSFQLYVRLASGDVKTAEYLHRAELVGVNVRGDRYDIGKDYLESFGIQPLKLIERVPVEFVGEVNAFDISERPYTMTLTIPDGLKFSTGMKFRCVQITEEA